MKHREASDFVPDLVGFFGKVAETERNREKPRETEGLCVPLHPLGTGNKVSDRCSLTGLYAGHRVDVPRLTLLMEEQPNIDPGKSCGNPN